MQGRRKITSCRSYANKKDRLELKNGLGKEKELRNRSRVQKIIAYQNDFVSENGPVKQDITVEAHRERKHWEDDLSNFLLGQSKCIEEFETLYGGRFLEMANEDRARQLMLERAREEDINERLASVNLAPIFVIDWSPNLFYEKDILQNSLFEFEYTSFLHPSRRVRKQLRKGHYIMNDDKFKCASDCGCRDQQEKELCKCMKKDAGWSQSEVECWDDCSCTATCPNRVLQRGRQMPLIIMRHHVKGWTVRAFRDIKKGEFIAEYTGEVLTYAEHLDLENNTYSVDLPCCFVDKNKKSNSRVRVKTRVCEPWMEGYVHRRFIITAKRMGNEGRIFSHSCEPNMEMRMTYIERHGYGYHHIAFYANEDIERFSELTWNYLGEALIEKQRKKLTFSSSILPKCSCGSKKCVIVPWKGAENKKKENRETEKILARTFPTKTMMTCN
ncbi:hypothetical protein PMAYCL1PPCAC_31694 [Pristionchus mayeri]|uniref:SET domain-containing protein n=1 Tax=Pristionchus mayeri TaxID=1317129 RepID=A0AAN5IEE2_9BILA|nr:hypothetical protein PMAYCL1PPCAC_31694 [Pristionchus mayeri]